MSKTLQDYRDEFAVAVAAYASKRGITLSDGSDYNIPNDVIASWDVAYVMKAYNQAKAYLSSGYFAALARQNGLTAREAIMRMAEVPHNIIDLARIISIAESYPDEKQGLSAALLEKLTFGGDA
jgi:hypothetical protein